MVLVSLYSSNHSKFSRVGLITYPTLMAVREAFAKLPIQFMRVSTSTIKFTVKVTSDGSRMDQNTSEITFRDKEKAMGSINMRTETHLKGNS